MIRLLRFSYFLHLLVSLSVNARPAEETPVKPIVISINTLSNAPDSFTAIIPFSRAGNLILIRAKADTIEGNFILDTGCPHLVLNHTYFRQYPVTYPVDDEKSTIAGAIYSVPQATIATFSFGNLQHNRLTADLVNLGHIENSKGVRILGLIGMQLLKRYEMIIDYQNNLIYIHQIGKKEGSTYRHESLKDTSAYRTVPFELTDDRIIVKSVMAGKKLKLIIDSGAESNVIDSRLPDKIFEQVNITGRIMMTGAGNKKVEALQGDMSSLIIGGQEMTNLPVLITNLEKTCFSYSGCVDGILGFDFLSLQKIGFNFVTRKMFIWK
jgi:hypothetical protein